MPHCAYKVRLTLCFVSLTSSKLVDHGKAGRRALAVVAGRILEDRHVRQLQHPAILAAEHKKVPRKDVNPRP